MTDSRTLSATTALFFALILALTLAFSEPGAADEAEIGKAVSIELNAVKEGESSCALTFMIINGHDSAIEKAVYETVLFDSSGQVDRLTLFDFGTLPPGRPRVRQFSVGGMTCANLGQILINGTHTCDAADLAEGACDKDLQLNSRTEIEVIG
ncbi:MAG: hypothetical protein AAFY35_07465 [Pseudomonadota bacterium]